MSTIALCIPAYNAAWCLPRLLKSAKNQLKPFDEILVYNDCSTDETEKVAIKYGATVVNGLENKGCSFGKNKLAEIAKSDWIHFHDADDELLPNFITTMKPWMQLSEKLDILLLNFEYKDFATCKTLGHANYHRESLLAESMNFILTHKIVNFALVKRKSFIKIGGFVTDQNVLYNEDRAFYCKAAINNLLFDYENTITCINYRYDQSMSASNKLKCTYAYHHVSLYLYQNLDKKYHKELAINFWNNAKIAASFQDWDLTKNSIKYAKLLDNNLTDVKLPFKILFFINPFFAFWLREKLIRFFKPNLREDG